MAVPARAYLSIGEVLTRLRTEFTDITISKIRFLESEGLIEPQRTPSGYRKFTTNDLERLRFVLLAQRDQYLPLKVIKENLDAMDRGLTPAKAVGGVDLGIPKNKTWIMPAGDTAEELTRMYPISIEMCTRKGYNWTGRDHIIAYGQKRGV